MTPRTLTLGPDLQLPLEAVTETVAILGIRGSGKTNTAVCLAEDLLAAGQQVVVIDPTDCWWGLRSSADGQAAGYPVVIFGGRRGNFPLAATDGAALADLIVEERVSAILALRHLESQADIRRLVTDFARRLYHRKGESGQDTPLMLIIDEAHLFVPQRVESGEAPMVGAIQRLVRQGRASGLGVTVIDQRASSVNKDILTQLELLICHRTSSPQDRKALDAWVEQHDTADRREAFLAELASLPQGTAWCWSPGWLDLFQKVAVRRRRTFDSSATPKAGAQVLEPRSLATPDLARLEVRLAAQLERAKAEDPQHLRQQVAQLQRQLLSPPLPAAPVVRDVPVLAPEVLERLEKAANQFIAGVNRVRAAQEELRLIQDGVFGEVQGLLERARALPAALRDRARALPREHAAAATVVQAVTRQATRGVPETRSENRKIPDPSSARCREMSRPQQRILDGLAWLESIGRDAGTRGQVAFLADASPNSSAFRNNLGALATAGLIRYPGAGLVSLTSSGAGVARAPMQPLTPADLHRALASKLPRPQMALLEVLINHYPHAVGREDLARQAEASPLSSAFRNNLGALRSLGFLAYPDTGRVVATPLLFLET